MLLLLLLLLFRVHHHTTVVVMRTENLVSPTDYLLLAVRFNIILTRRVCRLAAYTHHVCDLIVILQ